MRTYWMWPPSQACLCAAHSRPWRSSGGGLCPSSLWVKPLFNSRVRISSRICEWHRSSSVLLAHVGGGGLSTQTAQSKRLFSRIVGCSGLKVVSRFGNASLYFFLKEKRRFILKKRFVQGILTFCFQRRGRKSSLQHKTKQHKGR